MASRLRLATALRESSALRGKVVAGLGGIRAADRGFFANIVKTVGDGLDLDAAAREEYPEANRWDYVVSLPRSLVAIEPHQAKDSEVSVVIAKRRWARDFLRGHLRGDAAVSQWIWVTHGRVGFSAGERFRRQLDQEGIEFQGRGPVGLTRSAG